MSGKHLFFMILILVALLVGGHWLRRQAPPPPIEAVAPILPSSVTPDSIQKIELVSKDAPPVILVKGEKDWTVASAWHAPAKKDKIERFLSNLADLEGEIVSRSPDLHRDYDVADEDAIRIRLFKELGKDSPDAEILVGKIREGSRSFIRMAGDVAVREITLNLRSELGLWGTNKKIERTPWLQTELLHLDTKKVTRLELTTADDHLVFERREKEAPKPEGPKEEKEGEKTATAKEEKPKEYTWHLVEGGPESKIPVETNEVKAIVDALEGLYVKDVADPGKLEEFGFGKPDCRLVVTMEDGTKHGIDGVRNPGGESYIKLDGSSFPYEVGSMTFFNLFPKGAVLFKVKAPTVESAKVRTLQFERGGETIAFQRPDEKSPWNVTTPSVPFPANASTLNELVNKVGNWEPESYVKSDRKEATGLDTPSTTLTIGLDGGEKRGLLLGHSHPVLDGSYVGVGEALFVMKKQDVETIFPPRRRLFDLSHPLIEAPVREATSLLWERDGKSLLELRKGGSEAAPTWEMRTDPTSEAWLAVDAAKVASLLSSFATLNARDLLLTAADAFATESLTRVRIKTAEGEVAIEMGKELEEGRACRLAGWSFGVLISKEEAKSLLPEASTLTPPPPPSPAAGGEKASSLGEGTPPAKEQSLPPSKEGGVTPPEGSPPPSKEGATPSSKEESAPSSSQKDAATIPSQEGTALPSKESSSQPTKEEIVPPSSAKEGEKPEKNISPPDDSSTKEAAPSSPETTPSVEPATESKEEKIQPSPEGEAKKTE